MGDHETSRPAAKAISRLGEPLSGEERLQEGSGEGDSGRAGGIAGGKDETPESAFGVFRAFLVLGLTSFGGPIAHLGYFRTAFVIRRRWIDEAGYADLVALCQCLPGPSSSQVGFALGLLRAGPLGGLAAWLGFTLPSAMILTGLALGSVATDGAIMQGLLHGLKLVAVAVVAQAVWGMSQSLTPDRSRAAIALVALAVVTLVPGAMAQLLAIGVGAVAGWLLCRVQTPDLTIGPQYPVTRGAGLLALALFLTLLVLLPVLADVTASRDLQVFDAFYRSGALVFGGGHVVLPLLQEAIVQPGWLPPAAFLGGYGAAQAMPGPLFTVAAYLGASLDPNPSGVIGATLCLAAIFLPGLLLVIAALPFWSVLRQRPGLQAALGGINAAVVGLLAAALYDPVFVQVVKTRGDFALAAVGFLLLTRWKAPALSVVLLLALSGMILGGLGATI